MILPFMTKFPNGKPTAFIDKIWEGFICKDKEKIHEYFKFKDDFKKRFSGTRKFQYWDRHDSPLYDMKFWNKLHTIREDKSNRWKPGVMIDFFINARTKDMYRFAPRVPVVSIQNFSISCVDVFIDHVKFSGKYTVKVDDRELSWSEIEILAKNDGFDSLDEFLEYFNKDFSGKIIHWTDHQY